MYTEDQLALVNEIVPRTLRSLFVLRITLYVVAGALGIVKVLLSPLFTELFVYLVSTPNTDLNAVNGLVHTLNLLCSGLLASVLALVVATYFIQARIRNHAETETTEHVAEAIQP